MMGWCPYDGEECRHDGYCDDCEHNKDSERMGKDTDNVCNMNNKATIELYKSDKTGKWYINVIHHVKDDVGIEEGEWTEKKFNHVDALNMLRYISSLKDYRK